MIERLQDGRIVFADNVSRSSVAKKCPDCVFNVSCGGPKSARGTVTADVYDDVSKATDKEIEDKAECLKG